MNWLHVQFGAGACKPAWANSVLLYTTARLSTSAGIPMTLPFTVATSRSPTQKSDQSTRGCATTFVRFTTCGICAMFGAHEPYTYAISGWLPPLTAVSSFGSELSLLTNRLVTFSVGCALFHTASRWLNALSSKPV